MLLRDGVTPVSGVAYLRPGFHRRLWTKLLSRNLRTKSQIFRFHLSCLDNSNKKKNNLDFLVVSISSIK